jgi:HD-like signal output (HDOD) protein
MKFFPRRYRELVDTCRAESLMMVDAEDRLGLPSHTELGAVLCEKWELPEAIRQACRYHELRDLGEMADDGAGDEKQELRVTCVSNLLSNLALEELAEEVKAAIVGEVTSALGCDEDALMLLVGDVYQLRDDVERFVQTL